MHIQVPMEEIVMVKNETWESGASDATNELWETVVPGTSGWVQIPFPRRKNLPEGLPSFDPERRDDEVYIVTWGHQHHCLVSIVPFTLPSYIQAQF